MRVILCIDDECGMLFNHRRQSQDRVLREHIYANVGTSTLRMNAYSAAMFEKDDAFSACHTVVSERFLAEAQPEDCCFVENADLASWEAEITELIVYRWNRHYPADRFLTLDLRKWRLQSTKDFAGSSHEKITEMRYTR